MQYKAFLVEETKDGFVRSVKTLDTNDLPAGEVIIKVKYSSLNYKDALSANGNKGVTKVYPHTPGIDSAGIVVESKVDSIQIGDEVIVCGYDLGMNTPGGYGQYISVPAEWVVSLPSNLSLKEAMILGTAGFTAGISLLKLSEQVKPEDGKIIVSGATGGVGSISVAILSKLGYHVVAITGKEADHDFLKELGAVEIISRSDFESLPDKPILSATYAGGIDTVGGDILVKMIKSTQLMGVVTTCGSVSSTKLDLTVFPFILRAVSLVGISAQNYPGSLRSSLWNKLANEWKPANLLNIYTEVSLYELDEKIKTILKGNIKGRTLVKVDN